MKHLTKACSRPFMLTWSPQKKRKPLLFWLRPAIWPRCTLCEELPIFYRSRVLEQNGSNLRALQHILVVTKLSYNNKCSMRSSWRFLYAVYTFAATSFVYISTYFEVSAILLTYLSEKSVPKIPTSKNILHYWLKNSCLLVQRKAFCGGLRPFHSINGH